ncbi:Dyp-type peroxidase [Kocuria carniphila]|uniref:Dyp-type peroxidase n=1 Tax=Kocuria carniphila TaxID=262208 RepID=UPI0034DAD794
MPTQQILSDPAKAAIFLTLTINESAEDKVADILTDVSALGRAVSFRVPDGDLICVVGVGARAWPRLFEAPLPKHLHEFKEIRGDKHTAVSTPGDLLIHLRARTQDLCFELANQLMNKLGPYTAVVDETHGFKYFDERDLLGFVDGTENPEGKAAVTAAVVSPEEDPNYAGGSYVLVQKYMHPLDEWNALSVEEQERVIGRTKLADIELDDDVKPTNSHVALNDLDPVDGKERKIIRDNMPFGTIGTKEFGTYFIGYAADPEVTETMLEHMFLGNPRGNYDRILDFSTAETGALFFAPPVSFLDDPTTVESDSKASEQEETSSEPEDSSESHESLRIGSLKNSHK